MPDATSLHDIGMFVCLWETIQKISYMQKILGRNYVAHHMHAKCLFWAVKTELKANRASEI